MRHPRIPWHFFRTLSTAHASRTHVTAPQTDLHVKPDNSSGPTHDSPSERPLRTKATPQPTQAPKSIEKRSREIAAQANHGPTPLIAHSVRESGPRPEGQHRDQDGIHLDAQSHGRSFEDIGSDSMAPCLSHRSLQGLVSESGFGFSLFGKKDLSFFLSLLSLSN